MTAVPLSPLFAHEPAQYRIIYAALQRGKRIIARYERTSPSWLTAAAGQWANSNLETNMCV